MAIDFPNAPTVGDTYTVGNRTWTWSGTGWEVTVTVGATLNKIKDTDGDTLIQAEESADEDILRFDTAGTERMTIGASGGVIINESLTVNGALSGTTVSSIQSDISTAQSDISTAQSDISTAQSDITTLETDVTNINELQQNEQTGTTYTLALADDGKVVEMNNASANTLTVPPNSSVAFPVGAQILVLQTGAGQTTLAAGAGVTVNSKDGNLKLSAQWCAATLIKRATDAWVVVGDLSA
jgi:hypothetical protein